MSLSAFRVGLTGGIGCGKSTVADQFGARGAAIVDTDLIAHALTGPAGAAMPAIITAFGPELASADGALERTRMRNLIYADPVAKRRLEAILHPMIRAETERQAGAAHAPYVMLVVPLLVESGGWRDRVARVAVIDCPEEVQIARVMARNGLSREQVCAIMATQTTRAARRAAADDIIDNAGSLAALAPQIDRLHDLYLAFAKRMA